MRLISRLSLRESRPQNIPMLLCLIFLSICLRSYIRLVFRVNLSSYTVITHLCLFTYSHCTKIIDMFGGIGGAVKDLGAKAGGILEEQKKKIEEQLIEKRNAASAVLEQQKEKINDLLWQSKNEATEALSTDAKEALEGFENELEKETNRITDDALQQVSSTVDGKLKEGEEFLDEKREEAAKSASSLSESLNPSAVLEKAKGFLNF